MKWIGQHIYDLVSRFRDDFYLEGLETSTETDMLVINSEGKVSKRTIASTSALIDHDALTNFVVAEHYRWDVDISSTATIHTNNINDLHGAGVNGAAGQLLTDDGDGTVTSQSNVTYSTTFNLFDIQSDTSQKPVFSLTNANEDAEAPELHFRKAAGLAADGDDLGKIQFRASDTDNTGNDAIFAQILGEVQEADNNSEEGKLTLSVASHDQELQPGLIIQSGDAEDEVDVTIGNVATSLTTIAGSLTVTSDLTVSGTTTTVNTTNLNVEDKNITLNYNASSDTSGTADGAGITIQDAVDASNDATILWTAASDTFTFSHPVNATIATAAQGNITSLGTLTGLTVGGNLTVNGDTVTFESSNADDPTVIIKNTTNDNQGARLQFRKDRTGGTQLVSDRVGEMDFIAEDASGNQQQYAKILCQTDVVTHGQESGRLVFQVAQHDGTVSTGARILGGDVDDEIDIELGLGTASTTTIAGTLTMGSTAFVNNSGVIQVATQGTIDHDSLANFVAAEHYRWDTDISSTATIHTNNITDLHGAGVDGSANQILTDDGDGTVTSQSNVTWNNSLGIFLIQSNTSTKPMLSLNSNNTDASAPVLQFFKNSAGSDGDDLGKISFASFDDAANDEHDYAQIIGEIIDASDGSEEGKLTLKVASHDGELQPGLIITSGNVEDEVDVTIANGDASITTIAGDFRVTSDATIGGGNLTVSSGTSGDATLIIEADTDNNDENDSPRLWFKADGDITEGAIQHKDNTFDFINNVSSNGGIRFLTGTTNNTGTTDPETGATERMRIIPSGNVGIGVDDPTAMLEIFSNATTQLKLSNNADDFASFTIGANGNTTITTVDAAATAAHFEVAADGNITLDAAGDIFLESGGGNVTSDAGDFTIYNSNTSRPVFQLQNRTDDAACAVLNFDKNRFLGAEEATPADGDDVGKITFTSTDNLMQVQTYAQILAEISEVTHTDEAGKLTLSVASSDGTTSSLTPGLIIEGEHATSGEVDVTIGNKATSTTTIAGTLTMGSTATLDNSGNLLTNAATATALTSGDKTIEGNLRIGGSGDTSNNWITIDAQNGTDTTGGGICFYETGTDTIGAPQYGAKIVYNEDDDELAIGTMHNNTFMRQIHMDRGSNQVIVKFLTAKSDSTDGPYLTVHNSDTSIVDGQNIGRILCRDDDRGAVTSRINWVATEDHDSDSGGTKIDFIITPNGNSQSETTAMTIGQDSSLTVNGNIELGHASDTTIARSAAGTATIEGNQIMTAGVATGNIIHYAVPKYISLYMFYMNTVNQWYTPPGYSSAITTSAGLDGTSISASYQARMANYTAPRACKIKKVSIVFYQNSLQSGDLDLEWGLVKWTPNDDTSSTTTMTEMTITNHDGAFTETDVHRLIFDVTDNAASTLAAGDCVAFCGRVTSGSGTVRNLVNGQLTLEIELT